MTKKILSFVAFSFLVLVQLSSQNFYFKGKEIDPNKSYIIILSNGTQTSGNILNVDYEKGVTIQFSKNSTYTYKVDQVTSVREFSSSNICAGLGIGIPYGIFGLFAEFRPVSHLGISGGFGTTIFSGIGWNVGSKFYFMEPGFTVRPFISGYFGTNGIVSIRDQYFNSIVSERYTGLSLGGGVNVCFDEMRKHEFLIELLYIINPEFFDRAEVLQQDYDFPEFGLFPVKIAIGYAYRF